MDKADPAHLRELELEAAHFHGALNAAMVAGARLVQYVSLNWNVMPKDPDLKVTIGNAPELGQLTDAVQALTAATIGTGRLAVIDGQRVRFDLGGRRLVVQPRSWAEADLQSLRTRRFDELFMLVKT